MYDKLKALIDNYDEYDLLIELFNATAMTTECKDWIGETYNQMTKEIIEEAEQEDGPIWESNRSPETKYKILKKWGVSSNE